MIIQIINNNKSWQVVYNNVSTLSEESIVEEEIKLDDEKQDDDCDRTVVYKY